MMVEIYKIYLKITFEKMAQKHKIFNFGFRNRF